MAPSSITVKIDFGAETSGGTNSVSVSSDVPTPMASDRSAPGAADRSAAQAPTPFGTAAHAMAQAGSEAPAPTPFSAGGGASASASPSGGAVPTPLDSARGYSDRSGLADAPTPLPASGASPSPQGQSGGALPTPFDSAQVSSVAGDEPPAPQGGEEARAGRAAPARSQEEPAKKSRK